MPPPRVARAQLVEESSIGERGREGSLTEYGATFSFRQSTSHLQQLRPLISAAEFPHRLCHTFLSRGTRKNKLDFRPSKTPSVFAAPRCLTNVFFDFSPPPHPPTSSRHPSPRRRACCVLISCHISMKLFFNHTSR